MGRVVSQDQLREHLTRARAEGKSIVFTNGCFDLLHVGHVRYLQEARTLGDLLVVGVNADSSVRNLSKGPDRPLLPDSQRAEVLAALACVDYVTIFNEPDPLRLILDVQPSVLVKGGDWSPDRIVGREIVEQRGGRVVSIPLVPDISTTTIVRRIRGQSS